MITITSSSIIAVRPQIDGRSYVTERHIASDGRQIDREYLADVGLDTSAVMAQRAANIQAELQAVEAITLAAASYEIPLTATEFLDRFTTSERMAIRSASKTNQVVEDLLDYLSKTSGILRTSAKATQGLDYLTSLGLIAATRKAEILS